MDSKQILAAAELVTHLKSVLAFDLAITAVEHAQGQSPFVKLEIIGAKYPVLAMLRASQLQDAIEADVVTTLKSLEQSGVDTTALLQEYKEAGEKFAALIANASKQQNNQGIDNGA